jgi:hypothetical protein
MAQPRPPDEGGPQAVTPRSRTNVKAPPESTTDTGSVPRCGDRSLDLTGRALGILAVALAQWAARDDTRAEPEVRQAANTAMDAIDSMLGELHRLRARLVSEIRVSDDAAAARVDAMLAREADQ